MVVVNRVFWLAVLLFQLGVVVAPHVPLLRERGVHAPSLVVSIGLLVLCVPLVGLVFQRALFRHNFWAGVFGISVVSLIPLASALLSALGKTLTPAAQVLGATSIVVVLLCVFGQFVYVYGSPQLWGLTPIRGTT